MSRNSTRVYLSLYLAGAMGGFIAALGDILKNNTTSTVIKLTQITQETLLPGFQMPALVALLIISILGLCLCWIQTPNTRSDAFARGLSVFAVLAISTPNIPPKPSQDNLGQSAKLQISKQTSGENHNSILNLLINTAIADTKISSSKDIALASAYINITNVDQADFGSDNSSIIIRDKNSKEVITFETINNNIIFIHKPSGKYTAEINIPHYKRIAFDFELNQNNVATFSFPLQKSIMPLGAQMLLNPIKITPSEPNDDEIKKIGVFAASNTSFDDSLNLYDIYLKRMPNDDLVLNYKAYALFRLGRLSEALEEINKALNSKPENSIYNLNKIKILCSQGNKTDAKTIALSKNELIDLISVDGELRRTCPDSKQWVKK